jgi:phage shock protein PspC (stress-responsive transcriptional regulator)
MAAAAAVPESGAMPESTGTSTRKLVRLPDEGPLAGVCAGLARYLNVDPLIVRIAAFVLLFSGPGFFLYLGGWLFIPADDGSMLVDQVRPIPDDRHTQVVAVVLIVSAVLLLGGGWWWWAPSRHWLLPLMLIGVGCWLLLRRDRGDDQPAPTSVVPAPPAEAGTTEAPTAAEIDAEAGSDDTAEVDTTAAFAAGGPPAPPTDAAAADAMFPPSASSEPPASSRRRRRFVGPLVFGALLIWAGAAWLGGVELQDGLAIGLVILGGGFVLGAFFGGSRGLIFPAILIAAALVFTSVVDIPWGSGIGDREWDVDLVSQLEDSYRHGIGQATLDLGDLSLASTSVRHVKVELGIGHLVVEVPRDLNLEIESHAGAGEIDLLGREEDGVSTDLDRSVAGSPDQGTLELELEVGLGRIEVRRD